MVLQTRIGRLELASLEERVWWEDS